jgi:hypothetical protein
LGGSVGGGGWGVVGVGAGRILALAVLVMGEGLQAMCRLMLRGSIGTAAVEIMSPQDNNRVSISVRIKALGSKC